MLTISILLAIGFGMRYTKRQIMRSIFFTTLCCLGLVPSTICAATPQEEAAAAFVEKTVDSVAKGELVSNASFDLMSFCSVIYVQTGYLDDSHPVDESTLRSWLDAPPLFGGLLSMHSGLFAGSWTYTATSEYDGEIFTVKGQNGTHTVVFELNPIIGSENNPGFEPFVINMDSFTYDGKPISGYLGYVPEPAPEGSFIEEMPSLPEDKMDALRAYLKGKGIEVPRKK